MDERKDCKYGTSCTIKQCLFKHAGGPSIMTSKQNKTEVRIASPPKETMSKKKSSPTKPKKPAVSKHG
ncbi:hypothetical protein P3T76_007002 [Phytophthora citrophthora]|uniref:C3H1-type domain-containing protein n=1 Tax=Phytophthora citrophthora TaxID=4793 RepID=A0AAD9GPG2_9STRA|nr:hypothetical protein P3T76_007002 [Phytophthora citrophthora]